GVKVLGGEDGKVDHMSIQVGAHDSEIIDIKLQAINLDTLEIDGFSVEGLEKIDVTEVSNASIEGPESDDYTVYEVGNGDDRYFAVDSEGNVYAVAFEEGEDGDPDTYTLDDKISGASFDEAKGVINTGGKLLAQIDSARDKVDGLRSHLGAIQNRFESTITNLNNTVNNLSAARSRIEDADYAVEVSNMTRAQILQQAGTSVLAQANQVPQTVLSLLS